jgi:transposase-like protein
MNLLQVATELATEKSCLAYLEQMRWPNGVRCIECNGEKLSRFSTKQGTRKRYSKRQKKVVIVRVPARHLFQCLNPKCQYQFAATTGTIFHDSHLPLVKWFMAMALILDAKKGISANQIKRHLNIQYKTAWYLCHRIRKAMQDRPTGLLTGTVEVDETYIGGKYDPRRKRGPYEKQGVVGLIQRGGKVHAQTIPTPSKAVLVGVIRDRVSPKADLVVTDQYAAYKSVRETHRHAVINHLREYVRGGIHTNSIENFWSLLKRGIMGSFHKISLKHLPRYLGEFTYRFNNRELANLFALTLKGLLEQSAMTYKELIS